MTRPPIVDTLLMLLLRIGWWPYCYLVCQYNVPICRLNITLTRSPFDYRTYNTTNCSCSVDAHFDVLSIQHLLPSIIVFIMIWTYRLSCWQIETLPFGKAKRSNILALSALTGPEFVYLAKVFIAPPIHLFGNRYLQATAYNSPKIYLKLKLSVKLHREAAETLMHSVLLVPYCLIPPLFYCIHHHQHHFSLSLWLPGWPNQSGNI